MLAGRNRVLRLVVPVQQVTNSGVNAHVPLWRLTMSKATEFLGWLIEDVTTVHAEIGTPRDERLKGYEREGFLKLRLSTHGENTYEITSKGATGFLADAR